MKKLKNISFALLTLAAQVVSANTDSTDTALAPAQDVRDSIQITSVNDTLKHMPFQYSFIHPMGTNGVNAGQTVNNLSLNVLIGYQGGVDGVEVAGFSNTLKYDMRGAQLAGFSNTVLGNVEGGQFAGFVNTSKGYTDGMQLAGFANLSGDSLRGLQGAGFVNVANGKSEAIQLAGFANYSRGALQGVQGAGFVNMVSDTVAGVQAAGFANINSKGMSGTQAAGFANITKGDVDGLQISGFLNVAKRVKGVQIGIINIADTIENGVAIGVLNFVKNGYFGIELSANESLYANASLKMGTRMFYNIFTVGFTPLKNDFILGFGYGVGTETKLNDKWHTNTELIAYHINETNSSKGDVFSDDTNLLSKLNVNFGYTLKGNKEIFFGPSLNVLVTQNEKNGKIESSLPPYAFYDFLGDYTSVYMWAGINAGFRF